MWRCIPVTSARIGLGRSAASAASAPWRPRSPVSPAPRTSSCPPVPPDVQPGGRWPVVDPALVTSRHRRPTRSWRRTQVDQMDRHSVARAHRHPHPPAASPPRSASPRPRRRSLGAAISGSSVPSHALVHRSAVSGTLSKRQQDAGCSRKACRPAGKKLRLFVFLKIIKTPHEASRADMCERFLGDLA